MQKAIELGFDRFFMSANTFTSRRDRCLELCRAFCAAGIPGKATWVCMTRVELVDPELLRAMREAGCVNIAFGVETVGVGQWRTLRKGAYCQQTVADAFRMTKEADVGTTAFLMLGMPSQTEADIQNAIELVRSLAPDFRVVNFFQPFPGTPYWRKPDAFGLSEIAPLEEWNFHLGPVCRTAHLDKQRLLEAAAEIYLAQGRREGAARGSSFEHQGRGNGESLSVVPTGILELYGMLQEDLPLAAILDGISRRHGAAGRLAALQFLSFGLRTGLLREPAVGYGQQRAPGILKLEFSQLPFVANVAWPPAQPGGESQIRQGMHLSPAFFRPQVR